MFVLKINGRRLPNKTLVNIKTEDSIKPPELLDSGARFELKDPRSYADWYFEFIASKQLAMLKGGSSESHYVFLHPLSASHVSSINNIVPDTLGNITLLGSRVVDVSPLDDNKNVLLISRLKIASNQLKQLQEIYLFTMRLYNAFNHTTTRLLQFSPDTWGVKEEDDAILFANNKLGKIRGSLLNYQANVARWNFLVWKSSYIQGLEPSRQNLALSIGYACVTCQVSSVIITTKITKERAQPTEIPEFDSAYCLTIYRQSVSDDRQDKTAEVRTKITKNGEEIFGFGLDQTYANWETIEIVQELPGMIQSDKYSELFSLAPGMGLTEYIFLSKDSDPNTSKNQFKVETKWQVAAVEGGPMEMVKEQTVFVAAMNAKTNEVEEV